MEAPTAYDRVDYPGWPYPQSHPDRLATLAKLFGMTPADPANCRVLELGCGDGANLLPIAYAWPDARFVGIDLAPSAIARGCRIVEALGLANIDLRDADLARLSDELGEFDYVIAHGVYSWVPAPIRCALLEACRRFLAPQGVAFVSYNVYPGGHLRCMLRDALLMHVEGIDEPAARTSAAREFLAWILSAHESGRGLPAPAIMALEAARLAKRADESLFHDDLSDEFHLCYFRDFCAEAGAHGLQFLAEADFSAMQEHGIPEAARARLAAFAPGLIEREQYLDFLNERRFRQTLLCHADVPLRSDVHGDALWDLSISSQAQPEGDQVDPASDAEQRYRGRHDVVFSTKEPLLKTALQQLRAEWPRAQAMGALLESSAARCGLTAGEGERRLLADFALGCYAAGNVELHVRQAAFAGMAGPRPLASALARLQARIGATVTGLVGNVVALDDPYARQVLLLLDGTRDRAALSHDAGGDAPGLERCLRGLAACALLHGGNA